MQLIKPPVPSCILLCTTLFGSAFAQSSCPTTGLTPKATPHVLDGYSATLVASNLTSPRGIIFDTNGTLLVVQQRKGIAALSLRDDGGTCVSVAHAQDVILDASFTHGIELSADGRTLYASSAEALFAWSYDASKALNTSAPRTLVTNMSTDDHTTRTLLLARKTPGMMAISRGSTENLDLVALDITSGHSQIKAFNLTNMTSDSAYDYNADGLRLGWGLRNSVGVTEHPITGGIFSVENSVDDMQRNGVDVHNDNPGEEMNFHGYLNGTQYEQQGRNYGYPNCYAVWNTSEIPNSAALQTGMQFAIGDQNATVNDTLCKDDYVPPVLTFTAHTAPLDIKFNANGTAAWVTFHGSWDAKPPVGYKLSVIEFANGSPVAPSNSTTAAVDVLTNPDLSKCPGNCVRPVGIAFDSKGRLFMSSDATGEIWMITRTDGNSTSTGSTPSQTSGGATPAKSSGAASRISCSAVATWAGYALTAMQLLI